MPGHWEGDLFFGSHNTQIATLVERQTRYLMLVKVARKDTETVIDALIKQAKTVCCASTSLRGWICRIFIRPSSMRLLVD